MNNPLELQADPLCLGAAAVLVLLLYLNRLRAMNWYSHKAAPVAMHLCWALWLGYMAFRELVERDPNDANDALALLGAALYIAASQGRWKDGPPLDTESGRAALDGPLLRHFGPHAADATDTRPGVRH